MVFRLCIVDLFIDAAYFLRFTGKLGHSERLIEAKDSLVWVGVVCAVDGV